MATSGAHGLVAIERAIGAFDILNAGSNTIRGGIGITSGRLPGVDSAAITFFGFGAAALLPAFSREPPLIHRRMISISLSGSLSAFCGMNGSDFRVTSRNKWLASGSPGSIAAPDDPPRIRPE